jgi:hypothetical protein
VVCKFEKTFQSACFYLIFINLCLDGTSSVTFLPYIGSNYRKEYIIPNYIGESLSAMIPSIAGIVQGVGQDLGCKNVTTNKTEIINSTLVYFNETTLESLPLVPYFSVSVYYVFLFVLLCISVTAFTLLNFLPLSKNARKENLMAILPADNKNFGKSSEKVINISSVENISSTTSIVQKLENAEKKIVPKPNRNEQILLLGIILGVSFVGK